MAKAAATHDVIVVGSGIGGLTAAALLARAGLRTLVLDGHDKPGGCAGFFERATPHGRVRFDVGATALMGLEPGGLCRRLLDLVGGELTGRRTSGFRMYMPDRVVDVCRDDDLIHRLDVPAERARAFWAAQARIASLGWRVAERMPPVPPQTLGELARMVRHALPEGLAVGYAGFVSVEWLMKRHGVQQSPAFRTLVDMMLGDATQTDHVDSPLLNSALAMDVYRKGLWRAAGGMGELGVVLADAVTRLGGEVRYKRRVQKLRRQGGLWRAEVPTGDLIAAPYVVANLALEAAVELVDGARFRHWVPRHVARQRDTWGAATLYMAVPAETLPDDGVYFRQVLQSYPPHPAPAEHFGAEGENLLCSLSLPGDDTMARPGVRTVTISTHTSLEPWQDLTHEAYMALKERMTEKLLAGAARAMPEAVERRLHLEAGTPRSWKRYTRRPRGMVGGTIVRIWNSNAFATPMRPGPRGMYLVGDNVFPGQGTLAVAMSGIRAAEAITGRRVWGRA